MLVGWRFWHCTIQRNGSIKAEGFQLDIKADGSRLDTEGKKNEKEWRKNPLSPEKRAELTERE
jgi:hypothetical protein